MIKFAYLAIGTLCLFSADYVLAADAVKTSKKVVTIGKPSHEEKSLSDIISERKELERKKQAEKAQKGGGVRLMGATMLDKDGKPVQSTLTRHDEKGNPITQKSDENGYIDFKKAPRQ